MPDDGSTNLDTLSAQSNPSSAPPDIRRSLAQIQEMEAKSEKEQGQINKDTDTAMDRDRAAQDKAASAETDIMRTVEPWKQKMPEPDPISQFGSLGSVFGLLASAFTHQPIVNGLNAAAAAINASRANDLAAYKDAYNTWKENTDLALKRQAMEHQEYQDAHQAMMDDFNIGQSKLRTAIAKYGSPFDQLQFQQGEYDKIFDRSLKQTDVRLKIQELMPRLEIAGDLRENGMHLTDARKRYQDAIAAGDQDGAKHALSDIQLYQQKMEDIQSEIPGAIKMPAGGTGTLPQQRAALAADIQAAEALPDGPEKQALLAKIDTEKKAITEAAQTSGTGGLGGGFKSIYTNRILAAGNQVAKSLANVVQLPTTASTGWFGGREQGPSIFDASKEVLANKMTSQEVQAYNVMMAGIQRNLAAIESSGLAVRGSLTSQMEAVVFKEGDTNLTKLSKLAESRQIVDGGLEIIQADPTVPKELKEKLKAISDSVEKSVPFNQSDIVQLMAEQDRNPKATLRDIMPNVSDQSAAHPQDEEAIQWAKQNPNDPRSAQILKLNGVQ